MSLRLCSVHLQLLMLLPRPLNEPRSYPNQHAHAHTQQHEQNRLPELVVHAKLLRVPVLIEVLPAQSTVEVVLGPEVEFVCDGLTVLAPNATKN
ncbi:hypothetical protein CONPUDRAFT_154742 [Coniophora puteana RWD-64-598 SS2]|uniref:Secreted protein n=1 Tax=Coniophora puteana (strain RWD-64-598) TaxID=741705 RepID=A0A5M3MNX7_CONPW|nr:uncharacterized protein CONPUDRAFT_154742 [Coniophora puteana RWD-64-598 SS2]EIW80737.1 hypothetical protein CONPUDRAFT_154742 [Coniophora puteana RWD-64-598 SS2]